MKLENGGFYGTYIVHSSGKTCKEGKRWLVLRMQCLEIMGNLALFNGQNYFRKYSGCFERSPFPKSLIINYRIF